MPPERPTDTLTIVARKLNALGRPWMLVGSAAALLYGHSRVTQDIDVILDCSELDIPALCRRFEPEYMLDEGMVRACLASGQTFNAIPWFGGTKVDLSPVTAEPFDRWRFQRRVVRDWHGTAVTIVGASDLVISKLLWARESLSPRQLADVRAIMALRLFEEDDADFRRWITALGLEAALDASRTAGYAT